MDYSLWQKKIGEVHIAKINRIDGRTMCGRPMLGNNYAPPRGYETLKDIPEDVNICKECLELYSKDFSTKGSHGMACDFDRLMKKTVTVRNRLSKKQSNLFLKQLSVKFGEIEELVNDWYDTTEGEE